MWNSNLMSELASQIHLGLHQEVQKVILIEVVLHSVNVFHIATHAWKEVAPPISHFEDVAKQCLPGASSTGRSVQKHACTRAVQFLCMWLYGTWEVLDVCKLLPWCVGTICLAFWELLKIIETYLYSPSPPILWHRYCDLPPKSELLLKTQYVCPETWLP